MNVVFQIWTCNTWLKSNWGKGAWLRFINSQLQNGYLGFKYLLSFSNYRMEEIQSINLKNKKRERELLMISFLDINCRTVFPTDKLDNLWGPKLCYTSSKSTKGERGTRIVLNWTPKWLRNSVWTNHVPDHWSCEMWDPVNVDFIAHWPIVFPCVSKVTSKLKDLISVENFLSLPDLHGSWWGKWGQSTHVVFKCSIHSAVERKTRWRINLLPGSNEFHARRDRTVAEKTRTNHPVSELTCRCRELDVPLSHIDCTR